MKNTYHIAYRRVANSDLIMTSPVTANTLSEAVETIEESLPIGEGGEILYVVKVA